MWRKGIIQSNITQKFPCIPSFFSTKSIKQVQSTPLIERFLGFSILKKRYFTQLEEKDNFAFLSKFSQKNIRNFAVIAHIDHGKTLLSNQLLKLTETRVTKKNVLDALQVEQERGITVKAHTTSMIFKEKGEKYLLNLIDTPGHVDFTYEVSRSLAACQGALLVIDASQGIQAQTMANYFLAKEAKLKIIPVVNKIDLPGADIYRVLDEIEDTLKINPDEAILVSAKTGEGLDEVLPAIVHRIPHPNGSPDNPLKMLLFDSWYDRFRGVISLVEIIDGSISKGDKVVSSYSQQVYEILELGIMFPDQCSLPSLGTGQVGYIIAGMKSTKEALVGDTFYARGNPVSPLSGFKSPKPMVFATLYPVDNADLERMNDALLKLTLNDSSVQIQKEQSDALGVGYRCGFLGVLHMEVFVERMEQEYNINAIVTAPSVPYKVILEGGKEMMISNPSKFPEHYLECHEPMALSTIVVPDRFYSDVLKLCQERRGIQTKIESIGGDRIKLQYELPLSEIVSDFYDRLKEITSGYATFDYEDDGFKKTSISKVNVMLNGKVVEALSFIAHKSNAYDLARDITQKLKSVIDRQLFVVAIQAAIGSKVIARESISALRKNVTAKCYGGDVSRKRKLLEKQKEGKRRMKQFGNVPLSQEAFFVVMNKRK